MSGLSSHTIFYFEILKDGLYLTRKSAEEDNIKMHIVGYAYVFIQRKNKIREHISPLSCFHRCKTE
jgi:hypothetical protein